MRIFDETKTIELTEYDLTKGYLKEDVLETEVPEQKAVEEVSHYETIREYPNGGKDVQKVIDVEGNPYIPAHIDREEICVYIPYTNEELTRIDAKNEIATLKYNLATTDYQSIKHSEGEMSDEEFAPILEQRRSWRRRINELEAMYDIKANG